MPLQPDDFALVIGVNHYPFYESLNGPINDAERFYKWLTAPEYGGVPENQAHLIVSKDDRTNPVPLKDDIDRRLKDIFTIAQQHPSCRRLYVFFAGHGLGFAQDDTGMCMANWSLIELYSSLSSRDYTNGLSSHGLFKEVFFLLDCCRTTIAGINSGQRSTIGLPVPQAADVRTYTAFAAEFGRPAYEIAEGKNDLSKDKSIKRGHFTRALIAGLSGEAADNSGSVTGESLKAYLEGEVKRLAEEANQSQFVVVINTLKSNTTIVQLPPSASNAPKVARDVDVRIIIRSTRRGPFILQDGVTRNQVQTELVAGRENKIRLAPGFYVLTDTFDQSYGAVWAREDQEVSYAEF